MSNTGNIELAVPPLLVVIGMDASGKPHASRFPTDDEAIALRAAHMMKFHALQIVEPGLIAAAADLPEGKVFATGKGFVPFVKRELYDRFASLVGTDAEKLPPPELEQSAAADAAVGAANPWAVLAVGSTVLAPDAGEGGWYEAVVMSVSDDQKSLTVRWRDFPREPKIVIPRIAVGVLASA